MSSFCETHKSFKLIEVLSEVSFEFAASTKRITSNGWHCPACEDVESAITRIIGDDTDRFDDVRCACEERDVRCTIRAGRLNEMRNKRSISLCETHAEELYEASK